ISKLSLYRCTLFYGRALQPPPPNTTIPNSTSRILLTTSAGPSYQLPHIPSSIEVAKGACTVPFSKLFSISPARDNLAFSRHLNRHRKPALRASTNCPSSQRFSEAFAVKKKITIPRGYLPKHTNGPALPHTRPSPTLLRLGLSTADAPLPAWQAVDC
ncbi:hypothetical protein BUE80_DR007122, partial [Diplocarpon rosae]